MGGSGGLPRAHGLLPPLPGGEPAGCRKPPGLAGWLDPRGNAGLRPPDDRGPRRLDPRLHRGVGRRHPTEGPRTVLRVPAGRPGCPRALDPTGRCTGPPARSDERGGRGGAAVSAGAGAWHPAP